RLPTLQKKLRYLTEVTANISEVNDEGNELNKDQPNVPAACNEHVRPDPNVKRAGQIDEKKQRNEHVNVTQLIGSGARVKSPIGVVARFCDASVNQSHIID